MTSRPGRPQDWLVVTTDGRTLPVSVSEGADGGAVEVCVDGRRYTLDVRRVRSGVWSLLCDGEHAEVRIDNGNGPLLTATAGHHRLQAEVFDARRVALRQRRGAFVGSGQGISSPMPGKVTAVLVEPGQEVQAGQGLVVVEAMKMENELQAPEAGVVKEVRVAVGDAVESGQELVVLGS